MREVIFGLVSVTNTTIYCWYVRKHVVLSSNDHATVTFKLVLPGPVIEDGGGKQQRMDHPKQLLLSLRLVVLLNTCNLECQDASSYFCLPWIQRTKALAAALRWNEHMAECLPDLMITSSHMQCHGFVNCCKALVARFAGQTPASSSHR